MALVCVSAAQEAPRQGATEAPALEPERARILGLAERFASVRWRAEERHVFHGEDARGVRVDTPDAEFVEGGWVVGEENVGMPYAWGGFTGLAEFEEELGADTWAGHLPRAGGALSSARTVGVDCSGLVSRCWGLPLKQSTRSLGALSYELGDYDELQPGDIVNAFDAHTALFTGWADPERTTMHVIEAAGPRVRRGTYDVDLLRRRKFRPMRYKPLDPRWRPMPVPEPGRDTFVPAGAEPEFVPTAENGGPAAGDGAGTTGDPLPVALRSGEPRPGSWARYHAFEDRLPREGLRCTWMAVRGPPERLELQRLLAVDQEALATGASLERGAPWGALLTEFAGFSNPFRDLEVTSSTVEPGTWRAGDLELSARRVTAVVEGHSLSRSTLYPIQLEVRAVVSDAVPLWGLCEVEFTLRTDYGEYGTSLQEKRYVLESFGD